MENNNLLEHIIDIKDRLGRIEAGVEQSRNDHKEQRDKIDSLRISHATLKAEFLSEQKNTVRSAQGYSVLITTILTAIITGIMKFFGGSH